MGDIGIKIVTQCGCIGLERLNRYNFIIALVEFFLFYAIFVYKFKIIGNFLFNSLMIITFLNNLYII
jgi:hypothetical protein